MNLYKTGVYPAIKDPYLLKRSAYAQGDKLHAMRSIQFMLWEAVRSENAIGSLGQNIVQQAMKIDRAEYEISALLSIDLRGQP